LIFELLSNVTLLGGWKMGSGEALEKRVNGLRESLSADTYPKQRVDHRGAVSNLIWDAHVEP
jgi:hypothetical protein